MFNKHPLLYTNFIVIASFIFANRTIGGPPPIIGVSPESALIFHFCLTCGQICAGQAVVMFSQIRLLSSIDPSRRHTSSTAAFVTFIPIVGQVWNFFLVERIAKSLESEFKLQYFDIKDMGFGRLAGRAWSYGCIGIALIPYILLQLFDNPVKVQTMIMMLTPLSIAVTGLGIAYSRVLNGHQRNLLREGVAFKTEDQHDFDEVEPCFTTKDI